MEAPMDRTSLPALRPVESIVVPDREHGKVLVLRDTQGVTDANAVIPPGLVPVVSRFTGRRTCEEIAREVSRELGAELRVEVVVQLASELEQALFLHGAAFRRARAQVEREFAEASVRPAIHAGGAYHREAGKLRRYIEQSCLEAAGRAGAGQADATAKDGTMVGLVAPHIDPWRGALGYGYAYGALAEALPEEVDTFLLFGTSHAPMGAPFALCRKAFATPFGNVAPDTESIDVLATHADGFDPYADQFNHKREHSLEFQVVFLKHLLGTRPFRIVPVLAGLGAQQASGDDPANDARVARFIDGARALVEGRPGRVVVVAGADLAHVGPRFGDERPCDAGQRAALESVDRASLKRATAMDAAAFWEHVSRDLDARRVCGLSPIWSLLQSVPGGARGRVLHYEQTVDAEDGSIVTHAALGFYV